MLNAPLSGLLQFLANGHPQYLELHSTVFQLILQAQGQVNGQTN